MSFFEGLNAEKYDRQYSDRQLLARIGEYFKPQTRRFIWVMVWMIALGLILAAMPVAAYGAMMLSNMVRSDPPALVVVAPFAMGLPLIAAIERLWYHQAEIETSPRA